jgi:hypothetical protein
VWVAGSAAEITDVSGLEHEYPGLVFVGCDIGKFFITHLPQAGDTNRFFVPALLAIIMLMIR